MGGRRLNPDAGQVAAAHAARLAALDPLLPDRGAVEIADGDRMLVARTGESTGLGVARSSEVGPDDEAALWGALRSHRLTAWLAGPDQEAALGAVLDEWEAVLAERAEPGDGDAAAVITWPSRDDVPVLPLVLRGFAPLLVVAARRGSPAPAAVPAPGPDVRIRLAGPADLPALTDLVVALHRYDAAFGMVSERPGESAALSASLATGLDGWTWLAECAGEPVGFAQVHPPGAVGWVAPLVAAPTGYFGYLYVRPDGRSAGVGTALAARGHAALAEVGTEVTLLHHALPNPYSTTFWARQGYRPLWTVWQRRPAMR